MRRIYATDGGNLLGFFRDLVAPGSVVHSDGWMGYVGLDKLRYEHQRTPLRNKRAASELLPRVHVVVSLLKTWLLGTHQGAVSDEHLDYYLDEFSFRFNRRRSRHRGLLFSSPDRERRPYRPAALRGDRGANRQASPAPSCSFKVSQGDQRVAGN